MKNPFNFFKKVVTSINTGAANSIAKPIVTASISSLENLTTPKKIQQKEPQKNKGGKIRVGGYKSIQDMENHCS